MDSGQRQHFRVARLDIDVVLVLRRSRLKQQCCSMHSHDKRTAVCIN